METVRMGRSLRPNAAGADPAWRGLYRVGGACGLLAFAIYLVAVVLVFTTPPLPLNGGADVLEYVAANRTMYMVKQVLWLAPSCLAMLVFLALYVALRDLDRGVAAIGGVVGVAGGRSALRGPRPATAGRPSST